MKNGDALYVQIYQRLLDEIRAGKYDDARLPTERELMEQFYVSRITARKALNELADAGIVVRISGKGTFVRKGNRVLDGTPRHERHMPVIALVMGGYSPSFGLDIVNAALRSAEEERVHIILKETANDQKKEMQILEDLKRSGVDGIIVQPAHGEIYSQWLINAVFDRFPIVMVDRFMPGISVPFVGIDNERCAELAVGKLIERGHTNIALIALEDDTSSSIKARMDGYIRAYANHHLPVQSELSLSRLADHAKDAGMDKNDAATHKLYMQVIMRHLHAHPEITAVFGTEYVASKAAWDAAHISGWHVPRDLSIVGFDFDSSYLGLSHLTHIRQPQAEIGRVAVQMMASIIRGEPVIPSRRLLEGIWVEGTTLGPPRHRTNFEGGMKL